MSTSDLIPFLRRARSCLRETSTSQTSEKGPYDSLIFVKENCCEDGADGSPVEFLDEEDSSLTRYVSPLDLLMIRKCVFRSIGRLVLTGDVGQVENGWESSRRLGWR